MIELLLILVSLLLVLVCGAFVAAEFAFVTVNRSSVEKEADEGGRRARGTLRALRSLSTQLSAAQLGITITNLLIGFLAEPAIAELIEGPLESIGVSGGAVTGVAVTIALILATAFTMVFGELVPKNLAISKPLATAYNVQAFQRGFTRATRPLVAVFNGTANWILARLGIEPQEELASARSAEELASLVRHSAQEGTLELETATLLTRSLAFGERRADDVMTPRVRMHAMHANDPVIDLFALARETGRSRFPVLGDEGEDVVGIVHIKHVMAVPHDAREEVTIGEVMVDPVVVPSSLELDPLLETLRRGGLQMAVVIDEFGGVDGIVTLEDLVEEIVGEVQDEHDARDDSFRKLPGGAWDVSGLLRPDEVAHEVRIAIPENEEYETIGGLMAMELERVPQEGDTVRIHARDSEGVRQCVTLTVTSMDDLRVDRLRLEHEPDPEEDEEREEER